MLLELIPGRQQHGDRAGFIIRTEDLRVVRLDSE
jgi:hypothetical protein